MLFQNTSPFLLWPNTSCPSLLPVPVCWHTAVQRCSAWSISGCSYHWESRRGLGMFSCLQLPAWARRWRAVGDFRGQQERTRTIVRGKPLIKGGEETLCAYVSSGFFWIASPLTRKWWSGPRRVFWDRTLSTWTLLQFQSVTNCWKHGKDFSCLYELKSLFLQAQLIAISLKKKKN